jgi:hypothetical protein
MRGGQWLFVSWNTIHGLSTSRKKLMFLEGIYFMLIRRQEETGGKWWTVGHEIDASGSHVY